MDYSYYCFSKSRLRLLKSWYLSAFIQLNELSQHHSEQRTLALRSNRLHSGHQNTRNQHRWRHHIHNLHRSARSSLPKPAVPLAKGEGEREIRQMYRDATHKPKQLMTSQPECQDERRVVDWEITQWCRSVALTHLLAAPPSAESWLPVSLGVLTDLEGDTGVGTK